MKKIESMIWQPLLVVLLACMFVFAVSNVSRGSQEKGREQLEDALRRTAVAVYAAEGTYPPSLEYMVEHYGIRVDEDRYKVVYEVIASNLMPDITVLERNHEGTAK